MTETPYALSMKVIIRDAQGRCLVLKRAASSKNNAGKWDMPGGKVDPGEDFDQALLREVAEETGLTVSLERVAGGAEAALPNKRVAYMIMEARLVAGAVRLSSEHSEFAWVERTRLPEVDWAPQFRPFAESYARSRP